MRNTRLPLIAAAAIAVVALFLLLRPDHPEPAADAVPTATVATTAATTTTQQQTTTAAATTRAQTTTAVTTRPRPRRGPSAARVTVVVLGGRVQGGIRRASVRRNRDVVLVVRSDVADEVHLHGYDLSREVAPGRPVRLPFRATITGRFEVELEERGLPIAQLEVRP